MTTRKEDIEIFADHCVFMRSIYHHVKLLFEDTTADDKALMEHTAGIFFFDLYWVLREYLVLQVCKITDPAQDRRKNNNLSITFLLKHYHFDDDTRSLQRLCNRLLSFGDKLRPARDKFISHSDREFMRARGNSRPYR